MNNIKKVLAKQDQRLLVKMAWVALLFIVASVLLIVASIEGPYFILSASIIFSFFTVIEVLIIKKHHQTPK